MEHIGNISRVGHITYVSQTYQQGEEDPIGILSVAYM